jgi:hypothetical protein
VRKRAGAKLLNSCFEREKVNVARKPDDITIRCVT